MQTTAQPLHQAPVAGYSPNTPDALPWSDEGPETRWPPAVRAIIFLVSASAAWMAVIEAAVLIFG